MQDLMRRFVQRLTPDSLEKIVTNRRFRERWFRREMQDFYRTRAIWRQTEAETREQTATPLLKRHPSMMFSADVHTRFAHFVEAHALYEYIKNLRRTVLEVRRREIHRTPLTPLSDKAKPALEQLTHAEIGLLLRKGERGERGARELGFKPTQLEGLSVHIKQKNAERFERFKQKEAARATQVS